MGKRVSQLRTEAPGRLLYRMNQNHSADEMLYSQLLAVFQLCGFDSAGTPRHYVVEELRRILQSLDDLSRIRLDKDDHSVSSFLLELEGVLRKTREGIKKLDHVNEMDASQVEKFRKNIEELTSAWSSNPEESDPDYWSWVLLGFSMLSSLKNQLRHERSSFLLIGTEFDSLYSDQEHERLRAIERLSEAKTLLERRTLLEKSEYLDAFDGLLLRIKNSERADHSHRLADSVPLPFIASLNQLECSVDVESDCATRRHNTPIMRVRSIYSAGSVHEAITCFLDAPTEDLPPVFALLVVGVEGSGKTAICDMAELRIRNTPLCSVIRPEIPVDFLGQTVGATEDLIISLFGACLAACSTKSGMKVVFLLDDVDYLLRSGNPIRSEPMTAGWKRTFLSTVDSMHDSVGYNSTLLILCTSRDDSMVLIRRFDRVYTLDLPCDSERRKMLSNVLEIDHPIVNDQSGPQSKMILDVFESIVESTAGRSYSEMMLLCRQAILAESPDNCSSHQDFTIRVLWQLQERLSTLTPASLRDGTIESYVDMRVLTSGDLTLSKNEDEFDAGLSAFPFRGVSSTKAWNELKSNIVFPLCRSRELSMLLDFQGTSSRRVLTGGVLLSGPSYSGKSAIAFHCAKYAASLFPAVKLLDISCTSLIHKELGGSEQAVHRLFDAARRASPCIMLMDAIENIASVRGNDSTTEGTMDRVLSTLLVELDGVEDFGNDSDNCSIAVIGITGNVDWIDPAILRPGRLQKIIRLELDWK